MRADIKKKANTCSACLNAECGKNLKFQLPLTEKTKIETPRIEPPIENRKRLNREPA